MGGAWADSGSAVCWYSTLGVNSVGERKVSCCVTSVGVALGGRETAVLVMLWRTRGPSWIQDVKSSLIERFAV